MTENGLSVLIVEDEALLSLDLQSILDDLGFTVAGSAYRLKEACELARQAQVDVAILDLNLSGERVDPAADILVARAIPFAFATGYGSAGIEERFRSVPVLEKPYTRDDVQRTLLMLRDAGRTDARGNPT